MRKLLFITIFIPSISFAQFFDGGVVIGLSASQIDGDPYHGFNKLGLLGGGWLKHRFNYTVGGQLELTYIMKGAYETKNIDNAVYYKCTLHFVDIPFLVNYCYRVHIVFELGISPEFMVYNREEDEYGVTPEDSPPFHKLTISAIGGISYIFWERFMANVRYNYSLIPIREHPSGQTWLLNRGQYNNVLTFSLYYQISK